MVTLGLASALLASALFNIGVALQGLEARRTPANEALRLSLLARLLRRPRWIAGSVLGIVGIGPQVLALRLAPFVVVQTALAGGLLLLLVLGVHAFGEHVGRSEIAGVVCIIAGVGLVSWGAPPHHEAHRGPFAVVGVLAGLAAAGLFPFSIKGTRFDSGMGAIIASGCGFGATNVATKLMSDDVGLHHWFPAVAWAFVGVIMAVAATLTGMTAFQRRDATTVVPVSTAVQIFLPVLLEPLFLREHWEEVVYAGGPLAGGLVVALIGSVVVSRTRAVGDLAAAAQR